MRCETPTLSGARRVWRDLSESPLMMALSAGNFVMGENAEDKFSNDTERPAHRVTFHNDFALGCAPVTVGEFRHFQPSHAAGEVDEWPVVRVNWPDALAYCQWLSERTSRTYRLPSETEWEYACRAGSNTSFACGEEISPAIANYLYNEQGLRVGLGRRTPVGNYPANAFGFYDFHGNVCEWVADAWHANYRGAPDHGRAWTEGADARFRVIRGGAWDYLPRLLRSAWRDWRPSDFRADNIGFRIATSNLENLPTHET